MSKRFEKGQLVEVTFTGLIVYVNNSDEDDERSYDVSIDDGSSIEYIPPHLISEAKLKFQLTHGDVFLAGDGGVYYLFEKDGMRFYTDNFSDWGQAGNTFGNYERYDDTEITPFKVIGKLNEEAK